MKEFFIKISLLIAKCALCIQIKKIIDNSFFSENEDQKTGETENIL